MVNVNSGFNTKATSTLTNTSITGKKNLTHKEVQDAINKFSDGKMTLSELKSFLSKNNIKYEDDGNILKFKHSGKDYTVTHNSKKKAEEQKALQEEIDKAKLPENSSLTSNATTADGVKIPTKSPAEQAKEIVEGKRPSVEKSVKGVLGNADEKEVNKIMSELTTFANKYVKDGKNIKNLSKELNNIIREAIDELKAKKQKALQEEIENSKLPEDNGSNNFFKRASGNKLLF